MTAALCPKRSHYSLSRCRHYLTAALCPKGSYRWYQYGYHLEATAPHRWAIGEGHAVFCLIVARATVGYPVSTPGFRTERPNVAECATVVTISPFLDLTVGPRNIHDRWTHIHTMARLFARRTSAAVVCLIPSTPATGEACDVTAAADARRFASGDVGIEFPREACWAALPPWALAVLRAAAGDAVGPSCWF